MFSNKYAISTILGVTLSVAYADPSPTAQHTLPNVRCEAVAFQGVYSVERSGPSDKPIAPYALIRKISGPARRTELARLSFTYTGLTAKGDEACGVNSQEIEFESVKYCTQSPFSSNRWGTTLHTFLREIPYSLERGDGTRADFRTCTIVFADPVTETRESTMIVDLNPANASIGIGGDSAREHHAAVRLRLRHALQE